MQQPVAKPAPAPEQPAALDVPLTPALPEASRSSAGRDPFPLEEGCRAGDEALAATVCGREGSVLSGSSMTTSPLPRLHSTLP